MAGRSRLLNLTAMLVAIGLAGPVAAAKPDGRLVSSTSCPPNPVRSYAAYFKSERAYLDEERALGIEEGKRMPAVADERLRAALATPAQVAEHIAYAGFECRAIVYWSGGMKIAGFLWKPIDTRGERRPLIIVNRGGNGDFGAMDAWRDWGWHDFLKAGYVVLASQYRGGPGSEGDDEFGGRDVDDVAALIPLARSLDYVDSDRIFLFGGSRGGMETYMLARRFPNIRAMAIRAGMADLFRTGRDRPAMTDVFARRISDYATNREAALARRSVVRWANEVNVPAILFHGTADWRLSPLDSIDAATALMRAGKTVELHLFADDDHAMTLNQRAMRERLLAFFAMHGGPPAR